MITRINFTKKQQICMQQLLKNANKSYDECIASKPHLYNESGRSSFVIGYVEEGFKNLCDCGYMYMEDCE